MASATELRRGAAMLLLLIHGSITPPEAAASRITSPGLHAITRQAEGRRSDVERWAAQLNSADDEQRREAVMMLSSIEGDAAVAALTAAVSDKSPRVRAVAVEALSERGGPAVAGLLAARLAEDKDEFVRKSAAYALGKLRGDERTSALIRALRDKSSEVRGAAAVALGDHPAGLAIEPLVKALDDKNAFVRAQSARALGVNGRAAAQSVPALIALLGSDSDPEVKRQSAIALGAIGDQSARPALELARRDRDPYLARAASDALKHMR